MSGLLSITSRSLPRCVLRLSRNLESNYQVRSLHHQRAVLQNLIQGTASSKTCENETLKANRFLGGQQIRNIQTTSHLLEIVKVPPFADSVSEGDVRFTKKVGDAVAADEVVMEIETDKTTVGVPSPAHGIIEEIFVADGDTVKSAQQLFKLKVTGAAPAASAPKPAAAPAAPQAAPQAPKPAAAAPAAASLGSEMIKVPPFADSVSEGDVRFTKRVGDSVIADEVVMEIETDKTTVGVHSPFHGIIEEIFVTDGNSVKAGQQLFKLMKTAPGVKMAPKPSVSAPNVVASPPLAPKPQSAAPAPAPVASSPPPPPPRPEAPKATVPIAAIRHAHAIDAATVKFPPADYTKEITGTRTEQRVKMNRMRLKIASRLKEAQNTNAMLTTFNEIDMSFIMDFRKQHQDAFVKKHGIKLGFMSAFTKAAAYALQDQPTVNAVIEENEIIYRDYIDISVAVASPKGLVVPVLRNVEGMNFADIEKNIMALGEKAKKGVLAVEDMDGGTFTISNGGVFGSLLGTPIINPPQSAILGMHGTFERPVAIKGQVVIRPMMYIALTYDHRLIDGREAVTFLKKVKMAVEDPRIILAGL